MKKSSVIKVDETDAGPHRLVAVARADAAAGRAYFDKTLFIFAQAVINPVIGKNKVGPVADEKTALHGKTLLFEAFYFPEQRFWVHDNAVADHAAHLPVKNPRRNQVQHELAALIDHGVPGVISALITDHVISVFGQDVDDLAFT